MAQFLLRGLTPEVIEKLTARAQQNGRSLEAEVRMILQKVAGQEPTQMAPEKARALCAGQTSSDCAEPTREDWDR